MLRCYVLQTILPPFFPTWGSIPSLAANLNGVCLAESRLVSGRAGAPTKEVPLTTCRRRSDEDLVGQWKNAGPQKQGNFQPSSVDIGCSACDEDHLRKEKKCLTIAFPFKEASINPQSIRWVQISYLSELNSITSKMSFLRYK